MDTSMNSNIPSPSSFNVDKITLEYFTNKATYRKYLAKKDPKQSKTQLYKQIESYTPQLKTLFSQLLENPTKKNRSFVSYNDSVSHLRPKFESFMLSCLEHLEKTAANEEPPEEDPDHFYKKEDDEVMFSEKSCTNIESVPLNPIEFWKAQQVLKR